MKTIRMAVITVLIFMLTSSAVFAAAAETITKEYPLSAGETSYDAPEFIEEDGRTYRLSGVSYTTDKEKGAQRIEREYPGLKEGERVPSEIKEIVDGVDTILTLNESLTTYTKTKEKIGNQTYIYEARDPYNFSPEETRTFVIDEKEYEGTLKTSERSAIYSVSFSIDGQFRGPEDTEVFQFGSDNTEWPYDEEAPVWRGYQAQIIRYLDLDPDVFTITSGKWTGKSVSSGIMTRTAVFTGIRQVADYMSVYTITGGADGSANENLYKGIAVYESPETLKCVAIYERYISTLQKVLYAGAGIAIFALALATILAVGKKKRQEKEKTLEI